MKASDFIEKKKQGEAHSYEEIVAFVNAYMNGVVEDYQMSAWLMACCFQGLNFDETTYLTDAFIKSGITLDYPEINGHIADKHSTGGVGDKVTLVLIPILAALGINCAKLSGRGLGITGGTIDKLESIPGFTTALSESEFKNQIKEIGAAISSQTPNLVPADGKIYALRDVTATVDNKSLICASVVSKKIASGADIIVLDVKYGSGAFIKTKTEAKKLADLMIKVGARLGKKIDAVISSMQQPLGKSVGNSLEVIEAIEFLKGRITYDLYDVVLEIAAKTVILAELADTYANAKKLIDEVIISGKGLEKFKQIITAQKGNPDVINNYKLLQIADNYIEVRAQNDMGYIQELDAKKVAKCCKLLGAGRNKKNDPIDYGAGCTLNRKRGDIANKNDILATVYYSDNVPKSVLDEAIKELLSAFTFGEGEVKKTRVVVK